MSETNTWPELAIGLYDKLTGRGAEITYQFDNMEIWIPASTSPDASKAHWKVNGRVVVSTRDTKS